MRHINNKTTESYLANLTDECLSLKGVSTNKDEMPNENYLVNLKRVCVSRRSISLLGWHFNKIGDFISGKFNVSMSLTEEYEGIRVTWQTVMLVSQDGGHWLESRQNTNSKSDNEFSSPNKCENLYSLQMLNCARWLTSEFTDRKHKKEKPDLISFYVIEPYS